MKLILSLFFVIAVTYPCLRLTLQLREDIARKTAFDEKIASFSDQATSEIYALERGNSALRIIKNTCFAAIIFAPEIVPALQKAGSTLKFAQDVLWTKTRLTLQAKAISGNIQFNINPPFRNKQSFCRIPGELRWKSETIATFVHNLGGSKIKSISQNPTWHFHNPAVLAL